MGSNLVESSMAADRSSSDSDENKSNKKRKSDDEEVILNGDDEPLVEEVVEELLDEDSIESPTMAVNGDNFMLTVMKMNKAQSDDDEFATKLRENWPQNILKKISK